MWETYRFSECRRNDLGHIRNVLGHLWWLLDASGTLLDRSCEHQFSIVDDFDENVLGFQYFPASWEDAVYTIGKNVNNY